MAPLSRSHAEELLDPILSRFGPWDMASFSTAALSFTVVMDGAKSDFASVQLVPSKRPPKGAVLDGRFKGYIPFVTDFAFDWKGFRKAAARILAIPAGAIAIGVDTRGTAILLHAIGFSEAERKAVGRERMLEVALEVGVDQTRPNPRGGGQQQQRHHEKHSKEWSRISANNHPRKDWLMRAHGRNVKQIMCVTSVSRTMPEDVSPMRAGDFTGISAMLGDVLVFYPAKKAGKMSVDIGSSGTADERIVGTWTELEWQEIAGQPAFDRSRSAGEKMMQRLLGGKGMTWENEGDRDRLFKTFATPNRTLLYPPTRYGYWVNWLWDRSKRILECEWSHDTLESWRGKQAASHFQTNGERVLPYLDIVLAHLEAVVKALDIGSDAALLVHDWDETDLSGKPFRLKVGSFLKAVKQRPPRLVPESEDPGITGPRAAREAAQEPESRRPDLVSAIQATGASTIIDPIETSQRLLENDLRPEDFFLEDYVDEDPHFVTVRAAQYMPVEIEGKFRDALKAKSRGRVTLKITPRFPQWASGEVFKEWHRRTSVQKRRLMEVWVQLDKRADELEGISSDAGSRLHDLTSRLQELPGVMGASDQKLLQTQQIHVRGLIRSLEDLRDLTKKVRKKMKALGVVWAQDPDARPSTDERAWAELWLKDRKWRTESRTPFREGRTSVVRKVKDIGPAVKRFWADLDSEADTAKGIPAGVLRQVKVAIGRWQARTQLRKTFGVRILSKKINGLLHKTWEASGWETIAEDVRHMKLYAASSWGSLKDVAKYSGGVIQAPAAALRSTLGVPAAKLHDWFEETVLPGFEISVRKLARKKQRFTRKFDRKTGDVSFTDGDTGETVVPPRTGKRVKRAMTRAASAAASAAIRQASKATTRSKKMAQEQFQAGYQKAKARWRKLRMRQDAEGVRQAALALEDLQRRAEKLVTLGIPLEDRA